MFDADEDDEDEVGDPYLLPVTHEVAFEGTPALGMWRCSSPSSSLANLTLCAGMAESKLLMLD